MSKQKVKRSRIIISSVLTSIISLLSIGFGAYLGYLTLQVNYITIGTMTPRVGGLLVVAGFFIFFGCAGIGVALKEIFISSRNQEKFEAYKPALISAIVYYSVIALISIVGIIVSLFSYVPSRFIWTIIILSVISLGLCVCAFLLVLKELKEHKKKVASEKFANMSLTADEIFKLKEALIVDQNGEEAKYYNAKFNKMLDNKVGFEKQNQTKFIDNPIKNDERLNKYFEKVENKNSKNDNKYDLNFLADNLIKLEELKRNGIIDNYEYEQIKKKLI